MSSKKSSTAGKAKAPVKKKKKKAVVEEVRIDPSIEAGLLAIKRIRKEFIETEFPKWSSIEVPNNKDLMNFRIIIDWRKEKCRWSPAVFEFKVKCGPFYPCDPPLIISD